MPRRSILTARQRAALIDLPTDEASILYHYTLSDEDMYSLTAERMVARLFYLLMIWKGIEWRTKQHSLRLLSLQRTESLSFPMFR